MKKRYISIILLLTIIFNILLSCDEAVSNDMQIIDKSSIYVSTKIDIPDEFHYCYDNGTSYKPAVFFIENKAYLLGWRIIDEEQWITEPILFTYDIDSEESVMEKINTYNHNANVNHIAFDTQMNQITIESVDDSITLNKISSSGENIFSFKISSDTQKVITDSTDNIYVAFTDSLEHYDRDGNLLNSISFNGLKYHDFEILNNGHIYVEFKNNSYQSSYKYVNEDRKSLSNPTTKNADMQMYAGKDYDVYYSDSTALYGYNEAENLLHTLINWADSRMAYSNISNMYLESSEVILYRNRDLISGEDSIYIAKKSDETVLARDSQDIIIVTLKDVYMLDSAILNFNKNNNDYSIIHKSYYTPEDWSAGATKLNNEILAGNIPDIIIPNESMPMMSYINKGLFMDIYELIDNDSDLSRDSFYDIIYSTYEMDGKLYQLITDITRMSTLVTKSSNVNGKNTWTYTEFKDFYDSTPDNAIFSETFTRASLFSALVMTGLVDFVDYGKGTCDFENELFIDILNIIKSFNEDSYLMTELNEEERRTFYMDLSNLYKNDEMMVANTTFSSIIDIIKLIYNFGFEDFTFMGFPTPYGEENTSVLYGTGFMVTNQSKVKEGAWEFIKYYSYDEVQMAKPNNSIPTNKSSLKTIFEYMQKIYIYVDQMGIFNGRSNELSDNDMKNAGLTRFDITADHLAIIENLLNSKNRQYSYDGALSDILYEELNIFFAESKTAEETAKIIQNRASVYLSEIK